MRVFRMVLVVVMVVLGGLVVASPASAQVTQLSIGQPHLGPQGASVVVPVNVVCDVGLNLAFADASVVQSSGHRLAQGSGTFFNDFPGVPCTGALQTFAVEVRTFGPFAFKQGKASATVSLNVFDPVSGQLFAESVGPQDVRIAK